MGIDIGFVRAIVSDISALTDLHARNQTGTHVRSSQHCWTCTHAKISIFSHFGQSTFSMGASWRGAGRLAFLPWTPRVEKCSTLVKTLITVTFQPAVQSQWMMDRTNPPPTFCLYNKAHLFIQNRCQSEQVGLHFSLIKTRPTCFYCEKKKSTSACSLDNDM